MALVWLWKGWKMVVQSEMLYCDLGADDDCVDLHVESYRLDHCFRRRPPRCARLVLSLLNGRFSAQSIRSARQTFCGYRVVDKRHLSMH